jgi:hypothetical protein
MFKGECGAAGSGHRITGRHKRRSTKSGAALAQAGARSGWEWALFRAVDRSYYGSCWRHFGVYRTADGWHRVVHLPSGRSLTDFDRLRIARRFCEAIDLLTDWSKVSPQIDDAGKLQMHREALRLTGARPQLTVIQP